MSVAGTKVLVNVKTCFNFKDEHVAIYLKAQIMLSTSVCQTKNILRNLSIIFEIIEVQRVCICLK